MSQERAVYVYAAPESYRVVVRLHQLYEYRISRESPDLKLFLGRYRRPRVFAEYVFSPESKRFQLVGCFAYILILNKAADSGAGGVVNVSSSRRRPGG